ncbi:MAG: ATP-binding protein, partial [Chloroflexota bacterium]|nr:ATP-binding protein [Chloroflexota bacterium]
RNEDAAPVRLLGLPGPRSSHRPTVMALVMLPMVSLLLLAGLSDWRAALKNEAHVVEQRVTLAQSVAQATSSFVAGHVATVGTLALTSQITDPQNEPGLEAFLRRVVAANPAWEGIGVYDAEGWNIAGALAPPRTLSIADRPYFQQALSTSRPVVSPALIARPTGSRVFVVAQPVQFAGGGRGVLVASLTTSQLGKALTTLYGGPGFEIVVVDQQGQVLVHPDPTVSRSLRSAGDRPEVAAVLEGASGSLATIDSNGGAGDVEHLTSYAPLSDLGWGVLVSEPVAAAFGDARRQLLLAWGLLGTTAVLASAFAWVLSGRLARLYELQRVAAAQAQSAAEELSRQLGFTSAITRHLGEGVFALDRRGHLTFMNPAAERMLGWREGEVLDQPIQEVLRHSADLPPTRPRTRPHTAADAPSDTPGEPRGSAPHEAGPEEAGPHEAGPHEAGSHEAGSHEAESEEAGPDSAMLEVARQGVMIQADDETFTRRDGSLVPVAYTSSPILVGGETVGAVVAFHDITARKASEAALRDAARMREEFLAMVSHELRTPLTAVLGYADILLRQRHGTLTERQQRHAAGIRDAAHRQLALVNDLLDVSKLEAGKVDVSPVPVDPQAVVARAAASMQVIAGQKDVQLYAEPGAPLPRVMADEDRLHQIVINLLSNAIKFTPPQGSVTVVAVLEEQALAAVPPGADSAPGARPAAAPSGSVPYVAIGVTDTGIGIASEHLAHIWDRFYQADSSSTRRFGGSGLGLTIVKRLTELHGGFVTAASEGSGRGSTFTVWLPAIPATPRTNGVATPAPVVRFDAPITPAVPTAV